MSLAGKVIVVTGASSGIGAAVSEVLFVCLFVCFLSAVSEVLAKSGARVGLVGRDRARLDQVGFSTSYAVIRVRDAMQRPPRFPDELPTRVVKLSRYRRM